MAGRRRAGSEHPIAKPFQIQTLIGVVRIHALKAEDVWNAPVGVGALHGRCTAAIQAAMEREVARAERIDTAAFAKAVETLYRASPSARGGRGCGSGQAGLADYRLSDETARIRHESTPDRTGSHDHDGPSPVPGRLAAQMSRRRADYATIRLLTSVVAFPLFWTTALVAWAAGVRWARAFCVSLPLAQG